MSEAANKTKHKKQKNVQRDTFYSILSTSILYLRSEVAGGVDVHGQPVNEMLVVDTGAHAGVPTDEPYRRLQCSRQQLQQGRLA